MQLTPKGAAARLFQYPRPVSILFFCNWRIETHRSKEPNEKEDKGTKKWPCTMVIKQKELFRYPHQKV